MKSRFNGSLGNFGSLPKSWVMILAVPPVTVPVGDQLRRTFFHFVVFNVAQRKQRQHMESRLSVVIGGRNTCGPTQWQL
ncbi:hypothetical protein M413DRAFT_196166 [Hebeloma cylindrosporum]|uniref:Uncharacterized protein n=1 Tax=Hebeloma cylindrosporum TaxID=76867 RepID=A0A0C2YE01_HEBCY|nr:hypothetical protein M413DRAFT_196166 [Hebeloma cylindrosporum h7]